MEICVSSTSQTLEQSTGSGLANFTLCSRFPKFNTVATSPFPEERRLSSSKCTSNIQTIFQMKGYSYVLTSTLYSITKRLARIHQFSASTDSVITEPYHCIFILGHSASPSPSPQTFQIMNATMQKDWASPAILAKTEIKTLYSYRSAGSAQRRCLVAAFVVFAIATSFPIRSSAAMPTCTHNMATPTCTHSMATPTCTHSMTTTPKEADRDVASVFEFRRDGLDQSTSDSAIQGIIWGPILGVILILALLGGCAEHTRRRVRREEAKGEVPVAVARELRRDHEERTRSIGRAPITNITFVEMQRNREAQSGTGRAITQLQPNAYPQPNHLIYPPVETIARPKPPPAYFSQDGLPAYAGTSRADQVLGRGDAGVERPGAAFARYP